MSSKLKYRHYKGGLYEVVGVGTKESDGVEHIIYVDEEGNVWLRPVSEWNDIVEHEGENKLRFTFIKEEE